MRKLMARKQKSGPRPFRSPVPPNIFWSASRNVVFPMRTLMKGAVMAAERIRATSGSVRSTRIRARKFCF